MIHFLSVRRHLWSFWNLIFCLVAWVEGWSSPKYSCFFFSTWFYSREGVRRSQVRGGARGQDVRYDCKLCTFARSCSSSSSKPVATSSMVLRVDGCRWPRPNTLSAYKFWVYALASPLRSEVILRQLANESLASKVTMVLQPRRC